MNELNNYDKLTDEMIAIAIDLAIRYLNVKAGREETDSDGLMEDENNATLLKNYMSGLKLNIPIFKINDDMSITVESIANIKLEVGEKTSVQLYKNEEPTNRIQFIDYLKKYEQLTLAFFKPGIMHTLLTNINDNYDKLCRNCAIIYKTIIGIEIFGQFVIHFITDEINDKYDRMLVGIRLNTFWCGLMNSYSDLGCIMWEHNGIEYVNDVYAKIYCKLDNTIYIGDGISIWNSIDTNEIRYDI